MPIAVDLLHALAGDQMLGRDQHFVLVEVKRGAVIGHQHAVVGRHQHVAFRQAVAKAALPDQHRLQMRDGRRSCQLRAFCADPADFLNAVVAGDDLVAGLQRFPPAPRHAASQSACRG